MEEQFAIVEQPETVSNQQQVKNKHCEAEPVEGFEERSVDDEHVPFCGCVRHEEDDRHFDEITINGNDIEHSPD